MSAALELTEGHIKNAGNVFYVFLFVFDICQVGQIKPMGHDIGPDIGGPI